MAKGPGSTRSGSSSNPRGNGQQVNASRSQLAIEDRIIALEGERQRAIYAGDFDRRDEINAEIKALREQYRQAGEPERKESNEPKNRTQQPMNQAQVDSQMVSFISQHAMEILRREGVTGVQRISSVRPIGDVYHIAYLNESGIMMGRDFSKNGASKAIGLYAPTNSKLIRDEFNRITGNRATSSSPGGTRFKMPSMPKKDSGTRATVRLGGNTYEISHYSTGYGNDKRTNGTLTVTTDGRDPERFDYGPGPYRDYKNAREAYEAIKKMLRKRDSNS